MSLQTLPENTVPLQIHLPDSALTFRVFRNQTSIDVASGILRGNAYPYVPFVEGVSTVVDAGANVGAASLFFSLLYPEATIYAFEPGREAFALLEANAAACPRIRIFPYGLFSRNCLAPLYCGRYDSVMNSVAANAGTTRESEMIRLVAAEQGLRELGLSAIDILKIDTEGCEVPILESLRPCLPAVKILYCEYHSETDRRAIDRLAGQQHLLYGCKVLAPHRGELCYVNAAVWETEADYPEIRLPEGL